MDSIDHDALPAVLSVSGIGKTCTEAALADASLSPRAGELLALTNETDTGKRTLQKTIGWRVEAGAGIMCTGNVSNVPASGIQAEVPGVRTASRDSDPLPTLFTENLRVVVRIVCGQTDRPTGRAPCRSGGRVRNRRPGRHE